MKPLPSLSKTLKASFSSSSESESCIEEASQAEAQGRVHCGVRTASHLHFSSHKVQKLWEVDGTVAVSIDLVDHILQLCLSGILAKRAHDSAKLFGGDGTWKRQQRRSLRMSWSPAFCCTFELIASKIRAQGALPSTDRLHPCQTGQTPP